MIHRIYSSLRSFKELRFRPAFNILVATKSPGATDKQTRNRAGKTSLIELIHFMIGANCDPDSLFRTEALLSETFGMEFDLGGSRTVVERSGQKPNRVIILEADTQRWPITPKMEKDSGQLVLTNQDWKAVLGALVFGLRFEENEEQSNRFGPTSRSLFSYFVRRQQAGGFISFSKHTEQQTPGEQQVALTYLLGLDWTISQKWQLVREREGILKSLRKAAGQGALGTIIGTTADLRTKLAVAEDRARQLRQTLESFKVLPEYHVLEKEASEITRKLGTLANENMIDRHLISNLEEALRSEEVPSSDDLSRLYEEVGIVLPGKAIKRFEEVKAFHESVVENRKTYLSGELEAAKQRIAHREDIMRKSDARRAEVMSILKAHGALDHFSKLQSELSRYESETEAVRQNFIAAEQLEGQKTELEIARGQLELRLRQDFHEQRKALNDAILAFQQISISLYEDAGSLTIRESQNGPQFEIDIRGLRSKGINNMQIFCFDMMLTKICLKRGIHPGFLVHDSHLFDGVDSRQVAKALQIGTDVSRQLGVQYIVTMNSDALPEELPEGFKPSDYFMPVALTDATDDGGLFGMRFE